MVRRREPHLAGPVRDVEDSGRIETHRAQTVQRRIARSIRRGTRLRGRYVTSWLVTPGQGAAQLSHQDARVGKPGPGLPRDGTLKHATNGGRTNEFGHHLLG